MRWYLNLKMTGKLMIGFCLVAALAAFAGWQGIRGMAGSDANLDQVHSHAIGLYHIQESNLALIKISRAVRNAIIDDDRGAVEKRAADIKKFDTEFRDNFAEFEATIALEATRKIAAGIRENFEALRPKQDAVVALALEQQDDKAAGHLKEIRAMADQIDQEMQELCESKLGLMKQAQEEADTAYLKTRAFVWSVVGVVIAISIGLGIFISRVTSRPLARAVAVLETVKAGDFTKTLDVDTKDEVGQMATALNGAVSSIRQALTEVKQAADAVTSAAGELSAASEEISSGAQEQAASLEETAASLEEMTATVKQNAENSDQANQLAVGAKDVAEKGGQVVARAVDGMSAINQSSKKIAEIITAIDEIAFQTNLLALNAAVEAARAGEQGRGFAVVASEVRNLAQRSASAAKEIKDLIQDSVRKVEAGSDLVNQSGQTLSEIVTSVKRVTDIVGEITAASREQASGIDQVNKAVTQMDSVVQANASQTEEMSGTAEALAAQAEQLQATVARFNLGITTSSRSASVPRSRSKGSKAAPAKPAAACPVPHATAAKAAPASDHHAGFEAF